MLSVKFFFKFFAGLIQQSVTLQQIDLHGCHRYHCRTEMLPFKLILIT